MQCLGPGSVPAESGKHLRESHTDHGGPCTPGQAHKVTP